MTEHTASAQTPIDRAHAAMQAAPDDDTARLRFFERVADGEWFLLLDEEHDGEGPITPKVFPVEEDQFVLAFDREQRLAEFAGGAPYAAMSGRVLTEMLAGSGFGLGLNLSVAPSEMLLPGAAVDWLQATLGNAPAETHGKAEEIFFLRMSSHDSSGEASLWRPLYFAVKALSSNGRQLMIPPKLRFEFLQAFSTQGYSGQLLTSRKISAFIEKASFSIIGPSSR